MKRVLSILLVLTMAFALTGTAFAEGVQEALEAAAAMSNEELLAKAILPLVRR